MSSLVKILLIVFLLTNKTAKGNMNDLIHQFFKMIHDWIEHKLNKPQLVEDILIKTLEDQKEDESHLYV
jgi:Fe2+ transport system protein B